MTAARVRGERGSVIVLVALLITVVLVLASLVIDIGNGSQERRQAQNAADAAALTGAQDITSGDVVSALVLAKIQANVAANLGTVTWAGCTDSAALAVKPDSGNNDSCISFDANPATAGKVRVVIPPRVITTMFGGVANILNLTITAAAVAKVNRTATQASCGFCALGNVDLQNGNVAVTGGSAYFGGDIRCNPQGSLTSTQNLVVGSTSHCNGAIVPAPTATTSIGDPLGASSGFPSGPNGASGDLSAPPSCSSGAITAGHYGNISGCTLSPGLYIVNGTVSGNVTGIGVTIFFECGYPGPVRPCNTPTEAGGSLSLNGNNVMDVESCAPGTGLPACVNGAIGGIVLWFDRANSGSQGSAITVGGNPQLAIVGTVYSASGNVSINGTPSAITGSCLVAFCSQFIVNGVTFSGQGTLSTSYRSGQNYAPPGQLVQLTT